MEHSSTFRVNTTHTAWLQFKEAVFYLSSVRHRRQHQDKSDLFVCSEYTLPCTQSKYRHTHTHRGWVTQHKTMGAQGDKQWHAQTHYTHSAGVRELVSLRSGGCESPRSDLDWVELSGSQRWAYLLGTLAFTAARRMNWQNASHWESVSGRHMDCNTS